MLRGPAAAGTAKAKLRVRKTGMTRIESTFFTAAGRLRSIACA
jgi:hypothetical protein